eukprot:TRINITY_DN36040_c0_g1_i1.p1 TRINITY_DN36040_c0_g1~~TRINITY_DN36040_c0_g1_i1.p1  ORF type:complete len:108 (-),score=12.77 TRINITY_DN36040_c0_g1_i1:30-353(-)
MIPLNALLEEYEKKTKEFLGLLVAPLSAEEKAAPVKGPKWKQDAISLRKACQAFHLELALRKQLLVDSFKTTKPELVPLFLSQLESLGQPPSSAIGLAYLAEVMERK